MMQSKITALRKLGVFDTKRVYKEFGISRHTLARWAKSGLLQRVERGLYIYPGCLIDSDLEFAVACKYFGKHAAIAGVSAVFHYGLTAQIPQQTWLVVQQNRKNRISSHSKYRCLRTTTTFSHGISRKKYFRITSIERTIVESLWFSSKLGRRIAVNAARIALVDGLTTEHKLGEMAGKLGMQRTLTKYWESIVP